MANSSTMNVSVFIDLDLNKQAEELRSYFHKLGAEISVERSPKGIEDDLHKIIGVCDACYKDSSREGEVEEVFNGIVSLLAVVTEEKSENLILAFCEKLSKASADKIGLKCLKVMWALYQSLSETTSMRFHVYFYLIQLADKVSSIDSVYLSMEDMKSQFAYCPPNNEQLQKLLRLLHEVLLNAKKSEQASEVMVELLSTYTVENASQAREEAQRCIIASLADPQTFLLDHLLQLKPVKSLQGELIHDLLKIFVSDKLDAYQKFYESHREFVAGQGLKHENNLVKMKLLTFMQLAETQSEITFGEVQSHLHLNEDEVEPFVIDLLKTKLVRAKLDQANKVVHVSSTMHRTFTKQHWNKLHSLLTNWKSNLHTIKEQLSLLASAQLEMREKQI